jgi:hypothetical protein
MKEEQSTSTLQTINDTNDSVAKKCGYCSVRQTAATINNHTQLRHPQEMLRKGVILYSQNTKQCPHCLLDITGWYYKSKHVTNCYANQSRPVFSCNICTAHFYREYNLRLHMDRMHGSGRRRHHMDKQVLRPDRNLTKTTLDKLVTNFVNGHIDATKLYKIKQTTSQSSAKLEFKQQAFHISLSNQGRALASVGMLAGVLEAIAIELTAETNIESNSTHFKIKKERMYQITLDSPDHLDYPISSAFQLNLNFSSLLERLATVAQSAKTILFADDIIMEITERKQEILFGLRNYSLASYKHNISLFCRNKTSFQDPTKIQNLIFEKHAKTFTCVPVALSLAFHPTYLVHSWHHNKQNIPIVAQSFIQLCEELQPLAGDQHTGTNNEHFPKLGSHLWAKYGKQLLVIALDNDTRFQLLFVFIKQQSPADTTNQTTQEPSLETNQNRIYLFVHQGHAYYISNPRAAFPTSFLCTHCGHPRARKNTKVASGLWYCLNADCYKRTVFNCFMCGDRRCRDIPVLVNYNLFCKYCNIYARNPQCFDKHLSDTGTSCNNKHYRCLQCYRIYKKTEFNQDNHEKTQCRLHKCTVCSGLYDIQLKSEHECFMTVQKRVFNPMHTIYFDCETYTEPSGRVNVNVICCIITCLICRQDYSTNIQSCCGERYLVFSGENCLREFIEKIILGTKYRSYLLIAHYLSMFDGALLLEQLIDMRIPIKKILARGMRIMTAIIGLNDCHLRDSYLLYPISLNGFCKAMDVAQEKNFAPILYNSVTALTEGTLKKPPAKSFYVVAPEKRLAFDQFYKTIARKQYNFKSELIRYCMQDVRCLWEAAEKFRTHIHNQVQIPNIYGAAMTTAGAAMKIFRTPKFLKNKLIPIVAEHMATARNSQLACKYIEYMNQKHGYNFVYTGNNASGENRVEGVFVDGHDIAQKLIIEVHGCEVSPQVVCKKFNLCALFHIYKPIN